MSIFPPFRAPIIQGDSALTIATAKKEDISYIIGLAETGKRTQGFFPFQTFQRCIEQGRVLCAQYEGHFIGYTLMSAGELQPAICRHNSIIHGMRGQKFGTANMIAALLWADEVTEWPTFRVRTRTDIHSQIHLNQKFGGKRVGSERHAWTLKGERVNTYEIDLLNAVSILCETGVIREWPKSFITNRPKVRGTSTSSTSMNRMPTQDTTQGQASNFLPDSSRTQKETGLDSQKY